MNEPATVERIGWPTQLFGGFRLSAGFGGTFRGGLFANCCGVGCVLWFGGYNGYNGFNGFYCFYCFGLDILPALKDGDS